MEDDFEVAPLPKAGDTCVVAMSGGVDSTYCAQLLIDRGCRVIGATMDITQGSVYSKGGACFSPTHKSDIKDCKDFCASRGIMHYTIGLSDIYKKCVLDRVVDSYMNGVTPNPCVICNKSVKFGAFISAIKSLEIAFDYFCTGHYARVVRRRDSDSGEYFYYIQKGHDGTKDQSYFLCNLDSKTLSQVRFPLESLTKSNVYDKAQEKGIAAAQKRESQDFATGDYFTSIFGDRAARFGDITDGAGNVLGRHHGIENYTIGKRRGIDTPLNYPLYVTGINAVTNTITVGKEDELYSSSCRVKGLHFQCNKEANYPFRARAKYRLASPCAAVTITKNEDGTHSAVFNEKQKAITAGQSFVLYNDYDIIIAAGVIG